MSTLATQVQPSISVSMPSPLFLIALLIYLMKNNLACKPNYLILLTMFRAILFRCFLFVLFLISLSDQNCPYKVLRICFDQQIHHHCGQALQPVAKVSSFGLTLKHLCREDPLRKYIPSLKLGFGAAYKRTKYILLHLNLKHENILLTRKITRKNLMEITNSKKILGLLLFSFNQVFHFPVSHRAVFKH